MGWRDGEKTDWEQALGNLQAMSEMLTENRQRLQRDIQALEHLVAVLLAEVPEHRRVSLARQLASDAQGFAPHDEVRETLLRLAAVLRSRSDAPDVQAAPHKSLERGFHRLKELPWVR